MLRGCLAVLRGYRSIRGGRPKSEVIDLMRRCHGCQAKLVLGAEVCPGCKLPVKRRKLNAVELLWGATVAAILLSALLEAYSWRQPSSGRTVLSAIIPIPVQSQDGSIWRLLEDMYPELKLARSDSSGTRQIAVPQVFWNSMNPNEKTIFALELESRFPAEEWVIVTGPYLGKNELPIQEQYGRSELLEAGEDRPTEELVVASKEAAPTLPPKDVVRHRESEPVSDVPEYEILFRTDDPLGRRVYAEVLVPSLSPATPTRERRRVARAIVELEGLQDLTLYCNRDARQAHYSMEFADLHPEALIQGLLGTLERGRFKPYRP